MKLEPTAFKRDGNGTIISLHLQPGAKRSAVCGMYGEALKVAIKAPPVDGKANAALREFMAERLDLPLSRISLISGLTGRDKRLSISDADPEFIMKQLEK